MEVILDINPDQKLIIMRILKDQSAGLIVDIQEKLFPHIHHHDQVEINTEIFIKGLKILDIPLLVTEQYKKGLGPTIPVIDSALKDYESFEKMSFSCCDDPGIEMELQKSGKKFIIMAGIETHVCILQTAIDLLEEGFQSVVIEDCVSSRKENDKIIAIERMRQEGVIITSYESVLFELARVSGTDSFKAISKLVK